MLPREFYNMSDGYSKKLEMQYQADWERARWIASVVIAPHTKKRLKPTELITFPWEQKKATNKKIWSRGEVLDAVNKKFGNK